LTWPRLSYASSFPAYNLAVPATAKHLGFGVLVGPRDERQFRAEPSLRVEVLSFG
jgi:hypothetical protein